MAKQPHRRFPKLSPIDYPIHDPMLKEKLRTLESLREFLSNRLFDHTRTRESDQ
jgi:hypothetical protein